MTDIQKQKIKHLRSIGKNYKDIAIAVNLKESTVKHIVIAMDLQIKIYR